MRVNSKNILMCLSIGIIIFLSFKVPNVLFEIEDLNMTKQIYKKAKKESKIDVQAEKIYLVKAIHEMDDGAFNIAIADSNKQYVELIQSVEAIGIKKENIIGQLENEMLKLTENDILKDRKEELYEYGIINREYQNAQTNYTISNIIAKSKNNYEIKFEMEKKTGKILFISFPKEIIAEEMDRQKLMGNYVKYLGLYIIDDWKLVDVGLQSEKAGLRVFMLEAEKEYVLSIHSIEKNNRIEYYKN